MNKTISYLHNCNAGDLIAALPGMRHIYRTKGKKALIYQQLDVPGNYYDGAVHSVKDEKGTQVTMNKTMLHMLRPLLLAQEYIMDIIPHADQRAEIDLTVIRENAETCEPFVHINIPFGALPSWLMLAYPPMACDISESWIETPGLTVIEQRYILINRTERYQNPHISYSFLKDFEDELCFAGTPTEHALFCKEFNLNIPRLQVDDFLELAEFMRMCRFFIGNQSFPWNLANAMGIPRVLEMCRFAPNCQPFIGKDNYGFYHQVVFETFFMQLYHSTKSQLTYSDPDDLAE